MAWGFFTNNAAFRAMVLAATLALPAGGSALAAGDSHPPGLLRLAAVGNGDGVSRQSRTGASNDTIKRIQHQLSRQGFYLGPIDGFFGPETERAIRAYQKNAGLKEDGQPSPMLLENLETGGKIGQLLGRLEQTRREANEKARAALLSRPETRNLVEGRVGDTTTHDWDACAQKPEPGCLLREAALAAQKITRDGIRNWALGEILAAQARAGLAADAMRSTRLIHDPELIVVALREIAVNMAGSGRFNEAIEAAEIIPEQEKQTEAYMAIAEIAAKAGNGEMLDRTASMIKASLPDGAQADRETQASVLARLGIAYFRAGNEGRAEDYIKQAKLSAERVAGKHRREKAFRHLAAAEAATGNPSRALEILATLENGSGDVPVLMAVAGEQALAGRDDEALITADAIEAVRYRALVLARIATYQAGAGESEKAQQTLEKAMLSAEKIKFPYARSYAYSRIAIAHNDVADISNDDEELMRRSIEIAYMVSDKRLRAQTLWTIADERRRAGSSHYQSALASAKSATADIKIALNRVWMMCETALSRASLGETDGAWEIYHYAVNEALAITDPWGRSRALAKIASTLGTLADYMSVK